MSPHVLRHTFATTALQKEISLPTVQKIPDRHGFWGGRRLRRFSRGAEVSVSKSELLVAE